MKYKAVAAPTDRKDTPVVGMVRDIPLLLVPGREILIEEEEDGLEEWPCCPRCGSPLETHDSDFFCVNQACDTRTKREEPNS